MNNNDIIVELGIEHMTEQQQQRVIEELEIRVGEAMLDGMSAEQGTEYQAIINGDQQVITAWLETNDPGYQDTIAFQQLSESSGDGLTSIPADKVYASIAWIEKNNPQLSETVATIKAAMKDNLSQYTQ